MTTSFSISPRKQKQAETGLYKLSLLIWTPTCSVPLHSAFCPVAMELRWHSLLPTQAIRSCVSRTKFSLSKKSYQHTAISSTLNTSLDPISSTSFTPFSTFHLKKTSVSYPFPLFPSSINKSSQEATPIRYCPPCQKSLTSYLDGCW